MKTPYTYKNKYTIPDAKGNGKRVVNQHQLDLIRATVARGATDDELKLFMVIANRAGLDPFTRQIHFVKRGNRATVQTGIDGYRAIAERSGSLAGIEDAKYDTEEEQHPNKASVTVYRIVNGQRVDFTASARWDEYVPATGQDFMWKKMPYFMLGKVAEALALRKAFPNDLSGLYIHEEMQANRLIDGEQEEKNQQTETSEESEESEAPETPGPKAPTYKSETLDEP